MKCAYLVTLVSSGEVIGAKFLSGKWSLFSVLDSTWLQPDCYQDMKMTYAGTIYSYPLTFLLCESHFTRRFAGWDDTASDTEAKYRKQRYENGLYCWDGPLRSVQVGNEY